MDIEKIYQEWIKTVLAEDLKPETFIDESIEIKKKIKLGVLDLGTNRIMGPYNAYVDEHGKAYFPHRKGRTYRRGGDAY